MPATFNFTLDDLLDDSGDPVLREIHKDQPDPTKPLVTTASLEGNPGRLSTLSMGQIMMGYPIYNSNEQALSTQELVFTHLVAGGVIQKQNKDNRSAPSPLSVPGFNADLLVTDDIKVNAQALRDQFAKDFAATSGGGGSSADNVANPDVPADVQGTDAYKNTSSTGPRIAAFVNLVLSRQGDDYTQSNVNNARGAGSNDPSQASFDCSGLVWWAVHQLGQDGGFPNLSDAQFDFCQSQGTALPAVDMGVRTRGALLFIRGQHVAISLGDGTNMGADNSSWNKSAGGKGGCQVTSNDGWGFDEAALLPQFNYHPLPAVTGSGGGTLSGGTGIVSGAGTNTFGGQNGSQESRVLWAVTFLRALVGQVTGNNVVSIVAWEMGENTDARYNPLATTQGWPGSSGFNSNGGFPVQNYLTPDDGFNATIQTITNGHYDNILKDLQADADPTQTLGHFAGGPSGGADLNTWGTGSLPYTLISQAVLIYLAHKDLVANAITPIEQAGGAASGAAALISTG